MLIRATAVRLVKDATWRRRILVGALALGLGLVPLVGTLGYESSLVFAPILSILGALIGAGAVRRARQDPAEILSAARGAFVEAATLWAIAALGLAVSMLWQRNCDPFGGLAFFAMGPGLSVLLSVVAGIFAASLVSSSRPRLQTAAALLPFFACLLLGLWRLYVDPAVFALDPFWGHFAGPIYDEDVQISGRYIQFRFYNALVAAAALSFLAATCDRASFFPRWPVHSRGWLVVSAVFGVLSGAIFLRAPHHGFHMTAEHIARHVLPRARVTEHFVIHYAPGTATAREIDAVASEHEFAFASLEKTLGVTPEVPIESFVFASSDQKRAVLGAGRVEVAPPWRRSLYLNQRPYPHPSLPHELAHAFESALGDPVFGLPLSGGFVNMGLVEGLATAAAPRPVDGLDLHDQAAVMHRLGRRPPLSAVLGPGFWRQASSLAYTTAGSFVAYLLETHGSAAVGALYRSGGDFEGSVGASLPSLEEGWIAFLEGRALPADALASHEQRFTARPVFARPCAHRVFDLARDAASARRRGDRDEAIAARQTLCTIEPHLPQHKLTLADEHALHGEYSQAAAVLRELDADPELTATIRAAVSKRLGQVALVVGDLAAAREAFGAALQQPVGDTEARVLELQYRAAADAELAPLITAYFGHYDPDDDPGVRAILRVHMASRVRAIAGHRAMGNYLLGLQLMNVQAHEEAVAALERARAPGSTEPQLPPRFAQAAALQLLAAYSATGRVSRARAVLEDLASDPNARSGDLLLLEQWQERLDFLAGRPGADRSPAQRAAPARPRDKAALSPLAEP